MLYINNNSINPYFNHALEEYFLKNSNEEFFILWRNSPCILLGKNQNAYSEINIDCVNKNNITVVRRLSGGGAVFNDLGNINFGFISNNASDTFADFKRFTKPIIDALKQLSINAELSGRNDLIIDGKKFSGNAQAKYKNRVLHHGTLLFSSNMEDLAAALNPKPIKFEDKSVKSVSSRVTNISKYLKYPLDVLEFKEYIINYVMGLDENAVLYNLSEEDLKSINKLVDEKYSTWEWNFGSSPKYNFRNEKKFSGGIVEVNLYVEKGYIKGIKFFGDFFSSSDIGEIENSLIGIKHTKEDVYNTLKIFNINNYFTNITIDNILELLF